jgi:hypothetical protein
MAGGKTKKSNPSKGASKVEPEDEGPKSLMTGLIEYKGWQQIFKILLMVVVIWGGYCLYVIYIYHISPDFKGIRKYSVWDFTEAILYAFVFLVYKRVTEKLFTPYFMRELDPIKYSTPAERSERTVKCVAWIQAIIYYSFTTLLNLYLFRDQFFFPTFLGGSGNGSCDQIFQYLPYVPEIPYGRWFYMFQLGGHIYSTIHEVVYKRKDPKFMEMILHHGMTVFLIAYSYMTNNIPVGLLVLYTHDPGDVFLALVRMYNDLRYKVKAMVGAIYFVFVTVWVFFRLTAFPFCIVGAAFDVVINNQYGHIHICYVFLVFMLCGLVMLHCYWFLVILKILVNVLKGKNEPNYYDNKKKSKAN